jgi:hypothetical protein
MLLEEGLQRQQFEYHQTGRIIQEKKKESKKKRANQRDNLLQTP